jgi:hypothetical protein
MRKLVIMAEMRSVYWIGMGVAVRFSYNHNCTNCHVYFHFNSLVVFYVAKRIFFIHKWNTPLHGTTFLILPSHPV